MTAAKPDRENHSDRTMDAELLSVWLKQLIFISSATLKEQNNMKIILIVLEFILKFSGLHPSF